MASHAQTLPEVVNQALQTYPAVLSASVRAAATRSDIARARSAHYPQLGLNATATAFSSGSVPVGTERSSISPTARINLWSGGKIALGRLPRHGAQKWPDGRVVTDKLV